MTTAVIAPRPHAGLALAGWLLLCFAVAALGTLATLSQLPGWYAHLVKPAFTPPNAIFAPVWTILYACMAVSVWLCWKTRPSSCRYRGLRLFLCQLLLNLGWTWIFFSTHQLGSALIDLVLLWIAIALTIESFRKMSHLSAWLLAPYLAWVTYAGYLNFALWRLNRG